MMKRATLLMILLLAGMLSAMTTTEVYNKLRAGYANLRTYQANVVQTNSFASLNRRITYNGKIYYAPQKMLMHFSRPNIQRLQIVNGNITLFDAQSNTIMRSVMRPEFERMNPLELLQEYWGKSTVSIVSENRSFVQVKLVPNNDPMLKLITANISRINGMINNLSYTDKSGNSVTYAFSAVKLNGSIPASVWNYTYPTNAQIINR